MRILVVASPWLGGSGTVGIELAKQLAKHDEVFFLSFDYPKRAAATVHEKHLVVYNFTSYSYALFSHPLYTESLAERIIDIVDHYKVDVVHAHYSLVFGTSAILAKEALAKIGKKVAVVVTFHGTDAVGFEPEAPGKQVFSRLNTWMLETADAITTVSGYLRDFLKDHYQTKRQIEVIPNFVDQQLFVPTASYQERNALIHVSNFRKVKQPLEVVKAFQLIQASNPTLRLLLVGEGPELAEVKKFVKKEKIKKVEYCGHVNENDLPPLLNQSLALLHPSRFESFGLVILEAMAAGTPPIAIDVGGIPEFVRHRKNGLLVKNMNQPAADMAEAFAWLNEPRRWQSISQAGVKTAQAYEQTKITKAYRDVYARAMKG